MTKFFIGETSNYGAVIQWEPCKAKSLDGAKRAALRRQVFQGTFAHVGEPVVCADTGATEVAHRAMHRPARDVMPGWQDFS
jgi:hypothetical protein